MSDSLQPQGLSRLLCPWDFPGKNTRVSYHSLLEGIFLTQESNPGILHCRQILYHLSHQGSQGEKKRLARTLLVAIERHLLKVFLGMKRGIYLFTKLKSSEVNLAPGMWKWGAYSYLYNFLMSPYITQLYFPLK